MFSDSLSIGTTLPIESNVSKRRAKLAFLMPLTERLNNARYGAETFSTNRKGETAWFLPFLQFNPPAAFYR